MHSPRLIFRADGNPIAGYGHVLRSLALAAVLKGRYDCFFIIKNPDNFLKEEINKVCKGCIEIPAKASIGVEMALLKKQIKKVDIVVLDGYNFGAPYQKKVKELCFKVLAIDDIFSNHFVVDAVLNHGEGIEVTQYSAESYTQFYLGSKYAILRKPFLKASEPELAFAGKAYRIFVNLGGTDQQNYTEKALILALEHPRVAQVDVVVGGYYPHLERLQKLQKENPDVRIKIHSGLSAQQICKLMQQSAFGICSASTVSYEYASVGGLLFLYQTVANQKNIYAFMVKTGVAFPVKDFLTIADKAKNKKFRKEYFKRRKQYFTGESAKNLVSIFEHFELERDLVLRKAIPTDVLTYFRWVNEPEVRRNSVVTQPVLKEQHVHWFGRRLKDKDSALYIFEKAGNALGQVRFDKEGKSAEIDYSIDKKFRGKGFGQVLLRQAIQRYNSENKGIEILAKVKTGNLPSMKVFEKLGFVWGKDTKVGKEVYAHYGFKFEKKGKK